jgi:poly(A) polymerase
VQPTIYHASDHDIDHALIDPDAIQVIKRLRDGGYSAYLVGGSVRDLLIKRSPKDYDISTSARPEEIKQIFQRQCLLIGRRFRLAHVRFGHKIMEVATFRTGENDSDLITHDNVWGTEEEDVKRRDFTINGLFYDPATHTVIDYVGGWDDIHKGLLRTIGSPAMRFKQDPVRMLRLLKFRARFGFDIDPAARTALRECCQEIVKSSPARLLEEIFKMLESGASAPFISLMNQAHLLPQLFPLISDALNGPVGQQMLLMLAGCDKENKRHPKMPLDRGLLIAALLYPIVQQQIEGEFIQHGHSPHLGDISTVISNVIKDHLLGAFSHFPRRIAAIAAFVLTTQYRLTPAGNKRYAPGRIARYKEFELGLALLKVRALVDKSLMSTYEQWKVHHRQEKLHNTHRAHPNPSPHKRHPPQH